VLIFRRVVAMLLFLFIAIPSLLAPVYRFPASQPFAGSSLWNPYAQLTGTWQKANLHAHGVAWGGVTNGKQSDNDVVQAYKQHGYAVAGVSNYGSIAALHGVDTIPLYEHGYNISKAHQLAVGARDVFWLDFPLWQTLNQKQYIINRVGSAAELVSINHPNTAYTDEDMRNLTGYQLMEIVNGPFPVEDLWDAALSNGRVVWAVANDDAHDITNLRRTFIAWNLIDAPSSSATDVIDALRKGRSYAVSLVGNNADAALKSVDVSGSTVTITSTGVPATYLFVGQDGAVRGIANQVMQATYTFAATDTYIRAVIRTPNVVMYINPVLRYDGSKLPTLAATINKTTTWTHRTVVFVVSAAVVFLLWRRRTVRMDRRATDVHA
jgi:hypothetical protein